MVVREMAIFLNQLSSFFLVLAIGFLSTQCSSETKIRTAQQSSDSEEESVLPGNMSSGGGGTVIANPVTKEEVLETLRQVKRDLRLFLISTTYHGISPGVLKPLSTIGEVVPLASTMSERVDEYLELLDEIAIVDPGDQQSCQYNGIKTDGSFANKELCLSSYRLSQKLNQIDYYPQIMALAVHEFGHAMGLDEKAALELQKGALVYFQDITRASVNDAVLELEEGISEWSELYKDEPFSNQELILFRQVDELPDRKKLFLPHPKLQALTLTGQLKVLMNITSRIEFLLYSVNYRKDYYAGKPSGSVYRRFLKDTFGYEPAGGSFYDGSIDCEEIQKTDSYQNSGLLLFPIPPAPECQLTPLLDNLYVGGFREENIAQSNDDIVRDLGSVFAKLHRAIK